MSYLEPSSYRELSLGNMSMQLHEDYEAELLRGIAFHKAENRGLEYLCNSQQETIVQLRPFEPPIPA